MTRDLEHSQGVLSPLCNPAWCEYSYREVKLYQVLHNHRLVRLPRFQVGRYHPNRYNTCLGLHLPQRVKVQLLNFRGVDRIQRSLLQYNNDTAILSNRVHLHVYQ